jgi:hypothetical protein
MDAQTISGLRCIFTLVATLFSHFAQYVSSDSLPSLFRSKVGELGETGVGGLVVGVETVIRSAAVLSGTLEGLFDIYRPFIVSFGQIKHNESSCSVKRYCTVS